MVFDIPTLFKSASPNQAELLLQDSQKVLAELITQVF
jgi:hypothetical protein